VTSRDKSGKKLYECCDAVFDTCGAVGDASIGPEGVDWKTGPTSTMGGAFILHTLVCEVMDSMIADGVEPPVYRSANIDGSGERNRQVKEALLAKYPELELLLRQ